MNELGSERLFDDIGNIDDVFIKEADEFDFSQINAKRSKRIIYSAAGVVILGGMVVMYRKFRSGQVLNSV